MNVHVLAISSDTQIEAVKTVGELQLSYPVGYGLYPQAASSKTGAYVSEDFRNVPATGFLLAPNGKVVNVVYSS